ncbi:ero1-like protein isoform X1 [Maniola jurtina]|uniref:ero1-like protein isoform X1 n=1 Tax=Maniola jurtina TaxID=191418 RepID=UPI001E687ADA|nr:ero1-like protein isoform X1 [Maniola jurtina]XP_045785230.1 ero1-like protein isoform X1 [Maniola jurtina]
MRCKNIELSKMSFRNYCVVFIIFALAIVQAVGYDTELYETAACDSNACFEELHGALGDCSCNVDTIDYFNNVKIFPRIQSVVAKDYFRFYKVNLKKECPFWADDSRCAMKHCHIKTCAKESVPGFENGYENDYEEMSPALKYSEHAQSPCNSDTDHDPALGYLNMTLSAASQYEIAKWKEYDDSIGNFCECDDKDADAEYVDLSLNPERYTGYKGPSAHRIWRSIYQENCFRTKTNPYESFPYVLSSDLSNMCLEKRVFYRAISGLHTSINIHLCSKYLLSEKKLGFAAPPEGEWGPNLEEFQRRFDPSLTYGEGSNWLKNLYFVYLLEMRALAKAGPYLEREDYFTGNPVEDEETRDAIRNMLGVIYSFPDHFNESSMFTGGHQAAMLKQEFRDHFWNISRIMDCVGCDKCKLWGKLQTQGLGTALKILFSGQWDSFEGDSEQGKLMLRHKSHKRLQRTEIVALFNAFARLSNSIRELENFRIMLSSHTESPQKSIFGGSQDVDPKKVRCSSAASKTKIWS